MLEASMEKSLSKFMSKALRHEPEAFGLVLDQEDASCPVEDLLQAVQAQPRWRQITLEDLEQVVRNSDKQRYVIEDGRIRARYGHSHDKVRYEAAVPPAVLYHGTNRSALGVIMEEGLRPMWRQYVHLSAGTEFAALSGRRRGVLVMLAIDTAKASQSGVIFYYAGNDVWLAERVPKESFTVWQRG